MGHVPIVAVPLEGLSPEPARPVSDLPACPENTGAAIAGLRVHGRSPLCTDVPGNTARSGGGTGVAAAAW